jgi:hypothetical protein
MANGRIGQRLLEGGDPFLRDKGLPKGQDLQVGQCFETSQSFVCYPFAGQVQFAELRQAGKVAQPGDNPKMVGRRVLMAECG